MLTTNDILKLFNQKIDKTYTGYFDNNKLNRWFYEALLEGVESKYLKLDQQKIYDELRWLVSTEQPYNAFNNKVFLQPMLITSISYTSTTITFTTEFDHNLLAAGNVTISNVGTQILVSGNSIDGVYTINSVTNNTFTVSVPAHPTGTYTQITGLVSSGVWVYDYWHQFTLKCIFEEPLEYTIESIKTGTQTVINFVEPINLRPNEIIVISGITGTGDIIYLNDTFGVLKNTDYSITLDVNTTGGVYTSGGTFIRLQEQYARYNFSDRKISEFGIPSVIHPKFEIADLYMKLYPENRVCRSIKLDYLRKPKYLIEFVDFNNTSLLNFDWGTRYPEKLLYYVIDKAVLLAAEGIRDSEAIQIESKQIVENP
jgi:hypothetical protein